VINEIIKKYPKYYLRYDIKDKMLITREPMLVKDFINIKNIIRDYKLDVKEIRIIGRYR